MELKHLEVLVKCARQGDESVVPELRQRLERRTEFRRACGDLANQAQKAWLDLVGGVDLQYKESV